MNEKPSFDNEDQQSSAQEKPSFAEKPSFEPQENLFEIGEERRSLPLKKLLIGGAIVAGVIIVAAVVFTVLGNQKPASTPETAPPPSTVEIENTVKRFYSLLENPSDDVCNFFAEGVFDPQKPLETCRSWREENLSELPVLQEPIDIEDVSQGKSLVLYKLESKASTPSTAQPAPTPPTTSSGAEITPRSSKALLLQGGAVLQEEGGEWKIATLVGIPGTTSNESELKGELGEEYALLEEGEPLYELPSEEPSPAPDQPQPLPTDPKEPATQTRFSCSGGKRFDLVADVRKGDFRLFGEQKAAAGGDIREAYHSSGPNKSCLAVRFEDNYASVENLTLRLSHNSWQGTTAASFLLRLSGGVPTAAIVSEGGRERPSQIQFEESDNQEQIRVTFPTPPEWKARSAPRQFWFLRSSFLDPLGGGEELFDEGRPAGQVAPASAKNLEGGWPF